MKNTATFTFLALAALLAGCSLPPYNEELSLAQITKSKMELANRIGPVYAWLDDNAPELQYYFLPDRNDPANGGGFFVTTTSYGMQVWYLNDAASTFQDSWAIGLDNDDDAANNYLLQPIQAAPPPHYLSLVRYAQNDLILVQATDPPNNVTATMTTLLSALLAVYGAPPTTVLGSNIFPISGAGYDSQYFLVKGSDGLYVEVEGDTNSTSGANNLVGIGPVSFALASLPAGLNNAWYSHDPIADRSFLSYWSDAERQYRNYSWTAFTAPAGFKELTGIKGRIDAVLTSGELLSFEYGACTVYNGDGGKLYRFPLGGLKFCYERWDPADLEFKLYFSLAYWRYGDKEQADQLFIEVYAISTADLKNLD